MTTNQLIIQKSDNIFLETPYFSSYFLTNITKRIYLDELNFTCSTQ